MYVWRLKVSATFGTALHVTVFGQSHSEAIGCVIDGLPAGLKVDYDWLRSFMLRRAPGTNSWSTSRSESDTVKIISGLNSKGETCGAAIGCIINNSDTRSSDYENISHVPRPGHADYTAYVKWDGYNDVRGGGQFSGRLTAPLCAAGALAMQVLAQRGVNIGAHILKIADVQDDAFAARSTDALSRSTLADQLAVLQDTPRFPTIDPAAATAMCQVIDEARNDGDSVGGIIECVCTGLPAGIGGPLFDGIESSIAHLVFGVPAVKGIEFGAGFTATRMRGSQCNDAYVTNSDNPDKVELLKNDAGGNLGGLTTGAPLIFRVAIKPTPSIKHVQSSVDLSSAKNTELSIVGRHDPCIAPRAVPVIEAVAALATLDTWLAYPPHDVIDLRPSSDFTTESMNT